jgi:ribonuclease HII
MDEVGRGSPAGPVMVGLVVLDAGAGRPPAGVRDSKLLTAAARKRLVPDIEAWANAYAVGGASAAEVDALGVNGALGLAGRRAIGLLAEPPDVLLLDGNHDWLSGDGSSFAGGRAPEVVTRVRADRTCASVAAASIIAKVTRDTVMEALAADHPGYGWETNKGYGTGAHLDAIRRLGTTSHHRLTWQLPAPGGARTPGPG